MEQRNIIEPTFTLSDHREHTLQAFKDLASLDGIDYITVGVDLNRYFHLTDMKGIERSWDYANLVTLYREIYDAIKTENPNVSVGPGVNWSTLMGLTHPQVAAELSLDTTDPVQNLIAFEVAADRTIWSLMIDEDGATKADYIGVNLAPFVADPPFNNSPDPEDKDAVRSFYQLLPLVASLPSEAKALPIAFTQIDWSSSNNAMTGGKTPFLKVLKESVSHVNPTWASWRRLSDLPVEPVESSKCATYEQRGYKTDFCFSGLVDYVGKARDVWTEFIQSP